MKRSAIALMLCMPCVSLAHCGGGPQPTASASPQQSRQPVASAKSSISTSAPAPGSVAVDVVMAPGLLRKRLDHARSRLYDQAGERFKAGDHAGAA